jgi:hypothetical protein
VGTVSALAERTSGVAPRMVGRPSRDAHAAGYAAAIVIGAFAIPSDLVIPIGGLVVTPLRIALLVALAPAMISLAGRLGRGHYILIASDLLMLVAVSWMFLAMAINHDIDRAVESAGVQILELFGGYLIARALFGTASGYGAFIRALQVVVPLIVLFAFTDTLTGEHTLGQFASSLFGSFRTDVVA